MAKQHKPGFIRVSEDARSRVKEVDAATIKARLDRGDRFVLLDVREDHEWAAGHLPKAEHLGRGILERDIETRHPDPGVELVLYCGGGYRSALAVDSLQRMGYKNASSLAGGFSGWVESGYPVSKEDAK